MVTMDWVFLSEILGRLERLQKDLLNTLGTGFPMHDLRSDVTNLQMEHWLSGKQAAARSEQSRESALPWVGAGSAWSLVTAEGFEMRTEQVTTHGEVECLLVATVVAGSLEMRQQEGRHRQRRSSLEGTTWRRFLSFPLSLRPLSPSCLHPCSWAGHGLKSGLPLTHWSSVLST